MISIVSMGQEDTSWWQPDGSLKLNNEEHTFTSAIVSSRKKIKENDMLLVNLNNYLGEDQPNIDYGIYSKDLGPGESTELKIYHRKAISISNPDVSPNHGFDFTHDNFLIYGCKTEPDFKPSFENQELPWDAYGYYAHGWSFSETEIKSTDYKHLWNRPQSATWFDTFMDIAAVVLVVALSVAAVGVAAMFSGVALIGTSTIMAAAATAAVSLLVLNGLFHYQSYTPDDSGLGTAHLIAQRAYETDMEIAIPKKIENPVNQADKNYNKQIEALEKVQFKCKGFPDKNCQTLPLREVVARMKVKNAHVKHVNIPGAVQKNITPYQLFKNYQYITDKTGEIIASSINTEHIKEASEVFDSKEQILPRNILYHPNNEKITIDLINFNGIPTYYLVDKDVPNMDSSYYLDLGVYGYKNKIPYKLYRFQAKADAKAITISTGPDGPFLAGDNISTDYTSDLTISIFRDNDETPIAKKSYLFVDDLVPQIDFKAGDSVVFESKYENFSIKGVPEIWLARAAGESKYYCSPSIRPDEYRPFLGYDSQVHGVAVRKHPAPNQKKTPEVQYNSETGKYSWYWIAQRRMDPSIKNNHRLSEQNVVFTKYKEAEKLSNPNGFPIGKGIKIKKQRNNQREGYNMQLLNAWNTAGQSTPPVYKEYGGVDFILGTDPDEIIYLGGNGTKAPSTKNDILKPKALLKIDVEEWKKLPEGEYTDPINEMVTAYQKNRTYVNGGDYNAVSAYKGYEILDKGMYREHHINGVSSLKPFNGKPAVKFFQNGIGESDDNNKAPGEFVFNVGNNSSSLNIPVSLSSPQNLDSGFYGSIEGDQWPSEWQKNVPYSFTGLSKLPAEELNTLVMEYTHENELGILTKDTRYFRDGGTLSPDGKWTERFDLKGWGYNEITVYVQRKPGATMVPIAGMELLEVMLRFLSAPGSKWNDFSPKKFDGIDLKEGRGEGNYWYLRDGNNDLSNNPDYGKPLDNINKSYTFSKGDRVVFTAMDSDPHTFFHYDVEWYLSERFMAKRLMPDDLEYRIHWFLAPIDSDGLGRFIHKGRWLNLTFDTSGKYRLTAVYGNNFDKDDDNYGHTRMSHEITVLPFSYDKKPSADKGIINIYPLSTDQISWLRENNYSPASSLSSLRVAQVDDIFSQWTHVDGPRAIPPNDKPNRYGLENDYNAHFNWYIKHNQNLDLYDKFLIKDPSLNWFPHNWIRHYSGNKLPNDMNDTQVTGGIISTSDAIDRELNTVFPTNLPEPWQWRLPWISSTNWQGYRTRANIKAIFNMKKLFDNRTGAFAGVGVQNKTDMAYAASVSNPIPEFTDQMKSKYDFYLDLLSGRKLIFDPTFMNPAYFTVKQQNDITLSDNVTVVNAKKSDFFEDPRLFLQGADMSIVKNLEDNGVTWSKSGVTTDPYEILSSAGANVARFRLWVNPKKRDGSTYRYSTLESVTDEIKRAKSKNLKIILDLHYSDTWADPKQNIIPSSWVNVNSTFANLEANISRYTTNVLEHLKNKEALPDIVQIGNEINGNLLLSKPYDELTLNQIASEIGVNPNEMKGDKYKINWDRNARLLNAGLSAVRKFSSNIKTMLHLAGPQSAEYWLNEAFNPNVSGRLGTKVVNKEIVDIIGLSYYLGEPNQQQSIRTVKQIIENIGLLYNKDVLIVETAFPHTYGYSDKTTNLYDASSRGLWPESTGALKQLEWLITLKETLKTTSHGLGFVYWEPFWVGSKNVETKDFVGSNWENMSFFSFRNGVPTNGNKLDLNGGIKVFSSGTLKITHDFNLLDCTEERELPYHTSFESDFGGWSHESSNDFDWSRQKGQTPSFRTGPVYAIDGSFYLYTEASYPNYPEKITNLVSPCFDLRNVSSPSFSFHYHMDGDDIGSLRLEVTTDDVNWISLWERKGSQSSMWLNHTIDLSPYRGKYIKLRFSNTTGNSWQGDVAIDNLHLREANRRGENSPRFQYAAKQPTAIVKNSPVKADLSITYDAIKVYPNPTKDELTITLVNPKSNHVEISDIQGRVLYSKTVNNVNKHVVSTKKLQLSTGVYFVTVVSENEAVTTKKVLVE